MRLIDADELDKELQECQDEVLKYCNYDKREVCETYCKGISYARKTLMEQPTVEAIPIEQVARMIDFVTDVPPCHYAYPNNSDWCKSQNCRNGKTDFYECWLNALKEGWLDDAE